MALSLSVCLVSRVGVVHECSQESVGNLWTELQLAVDLVEGFCIFAASLSNRRGRLLVPMILLLF